jgi:hypothetical protein
MLALEHTGRLAARLVALAHALDETLVEVEALSQDHQPELGDAARWLPPLRDALAQLQLAAAEARFAARELRESLPSPETVQPRLL